MILTEIQELPAYFSQEGLRLEIILNQLIKNSLVLAGFISVPPIIHCSPTMLFL